VGVVPGDAASGRIAKPQVRTEFEYQKAQRSRKEAAEALRRGDRDAASAMLRDAGDALMEAAQGMPASQAVELLAESDELLTGAASALAEDAALSAKRNYAAHNAKSRKRQSWEAQLREDEEWQRRREEERRRAAAEDGEGEGKFG
jgi:Ca-activated chloride channel family protein